MLLSELFGYLTYGELQQLELGGLEDRGITDKNQAQVITNINLGLIELFKRFPLSTKEVFIQLFSHVSNYIIHSDYAVTNTASTKPDKWVLDTVVDPFVDDILMIDVVHDELGKELPLNDINKDTAVFTATYNTLQVPFATDNNSISVIYRSTPTKISVDADPATAWIDLPDQFTDALVNYVSSKIYTGNDTDGKNLAGVFYNKFEASVALLKRQGLVNLEEVENQRIGSNGWV